MVHSSLTFFQTSVNPVSSKFCTTAIGIDHAAPLEARFSLVRAVGLHEQGQSLKALPCTAFKGALLGNDLQKVFHFFLL